jgi:hypothetical protein
VEQGGKRTRFTISGSRWNLPSELLKAVPVGGNARRNVFPARVEECQAAALFLIAPMIAVRIAPPAPPAIACETMPPMLRLPDCAAAMPLV